MAVGEVEEESTLATGCAFGMGLLLSFGIGFMWGLMAFMAVTHGPHTKSATLFALLAPGGFFVALSFLPIHAGFRRGLLVGGCVVLMLGGMCGSVMLNG